MKTPISRPTIVIDIRARNL